VNNFVAVIDNNEEDIRALIRASLEKERFRVQEHCEAKGFLASLASERPDFFMLDLMFPDMHGAQTVRILVFRSLCAARLPMRPTCSSAFNSAPMTLQ